MYKEIVDKIIELLKGHEDLAWPTKIKEYHFGIPVNFAKVRYPAIYVQFNSRRFSGEAYMNQFLYDLAFEIGVADRSIKEDEAEKSVYDKLEAIDSVLRNNPTLDGLVYGMILTSNMEVVHASESDYAVAIARVIHIAKKWMN